MGGDAVDSWRRVDAHRRAPPGRDTARSQAQREARKLLLLAHGSMASGRGWKPIAWLLRGGSPGRACSGCKLARAANWSARGLVGRLRGARGTARRRGVPELRDWARGAERSVERELFRQPPGCRLAVRRHWGHLRARRSDWPLAQATCARPQNGAEGRIAIARTDRLTQRFIP
jgi:hypothetical protein